MKRSRRHSAFLVHFCSVCCCSAAVAAAMVVAEEEVEEVVVAVVEAERLPAEPFQSNCRRRQSQFPKS